MTAPRPLRRWRILRQQWAQPTTDLHALRRARGRARYNRLRQRVAAWRRRVLRQLLTQRGRGGLVSLEGAGTRELYAAYWELTGASRRTFFADLKVLREARDAARLRAGIGAVPPGPGAGEGDGASVGPPNPSATSASPSAAPQSAAPGRRALLSSWYWYCVTLELSLDRLLPPEVAGAVRALAQQYLERLAPPRRVELSPPPPPPPPPPLLPAAGAAGPWPTTTMLLRAMYGTASPVSEGMRPRATPSSSSDARPPLPPRRPPAPPARDPADWW